MAKLKADEIDAHMFLVRIKHADKETGRTDMSNGSSFQNEIADWFKEKQHLPDWAEVAQKETVAYIKRQQPKIDPAALPEFEPDALLALSLDEAIYIPEAKAKARDLRDHLEVREEVKNRHDMAHAKWTRFLRGELAKFSSTTETWMDVKRREAGEGGQDVAAD